MSPSSSPRSTGRAHCTRLHSVSWPLGCPLLASRLSPPLSAFTDVKTETPFTRHESHPAVAVTQWVEYIHEVTLRDPHHPPLPGRSLGRGGSSAHGQRVSSPHACCKMSGDNPEERAASQGSQVWPNQEQAEWRPGSGHESPMVSTGPPLSPAGWAQRGCDCGVTQGLPQGCPAWFFASEMLLSTPSRKPQ